MQQTVTIREVFSSRDDAEEARERLEYEGFARNSMNIMRIGDHFELTIHTRPENQQRVEELIDASDMLFEARRYGRHLGENAPSAAQSVLVVGVLAAICAGLYYAIRRQRDIYAQTYSARQRSAVRSLYQAHREPPGRLDRTRDCDLPENSKENLEKKLDQALHETFPTSDPVSVTITR